MEMNISDWQGINPLQNVSGIPPSAGTERRAQLQAPSEPTDQMQLCNLAQVTEAYGDSEAQIAQLSALSSSVASGRYHVPGDVVSHSIIEATLRLGGGNYN